MTSPAEHVIGLIGGLTKTAKLLSTPEKAFPISTVQSWKERGEIPQKHWKTLIAQAADVGVDLSFPDFCEAPSEAAQ